MRSLPNRADGCRVCQLVETRTEFLEAGKITVETIPLLELISHQTLNQTFRIDVCYDAV
jgi:hypothetical protein